MIPTSQTQALPRPRRGLDPAWHALASETAIDPTRPIIDAHHHIWREKRGFPYLVEQLAEDIATGHNIIATVFVTSSTHYRNDGPRHLRPVGETEWIASQTQDYMQAHPDAPSLCAGIVGHIDLRDDPARVDEAVQAHRAASSRFRGVRQSATWSDDDEINVGRPEMPRHLYLDAKFRKGYARLAQHGLSFDAYVFHDQLPELIELARTFPDTPIVCDHLGAPLGQGRWARQRDAVFQDWKRCINELARSPNVTLKLGGCAMPMFGFNWDHLATPPDSDQMVKATRHFHEHAIEAFSPSRCMFESNFPVDKLACAFVPLWNSFKKIAAQYSEAERANLFCNTARRIYRLDTVTMTA